MRLEEGGREGEGVRKEIMRYGDLLVEDDSVSPIHSARIIIF